ncbi:hypothetical protein ACQZV8_08910 [Magnetococcales bacterium HHB-1]
MANESESKESGFEGFVEQVKDNIESIRETVKSDAKEYKNALYNDQRYLRGEYHNVVSICGGRGSGKTFLLNEVVNGCRSKDLVLPIITPDMVMGSHSLFGLVLGMIYHQAEGGAKKEKERSSWSGKCDKGSKKLNELMGEIKKLGTQRAKSGLRFFNNLMRSGASGSEFSTQFVDAEWGFVSLLNDYPHIVAKTLNILSKKDGEESSKLLIIPIDDLDIKPEMGKTILQDLTLLCRSPHVVILIAYEEKAMRSLIASEYLNSFNKKVQYFWQPCESQPDNKKEDKHSYDDYVCSEIDRLYEKVFPIFSKTVLPSLERTEDRLMFSPFFLTKGGEKLPPLFEIMEKITFENNVFRPYIKTLRDVFDVKRYVVPDDVSDQPPVIPSIIADILPKPRRGLISVYQKLSQERYQKKLSRKKTFELILFLMECSYVNMAVKDVQEVKKRVHLSVSTSVSLLDLGDIQFSFNETQLYWYSMVMNGEKVFLRMNELGECGTMKACKGYHNAPHIALSTLIHDTLYKNGERTNKNAGALFYVNKQFPPVESRHHFEQYRSSSFYSISFDRSQDIYSIGIINEIWKKWFKDLEVCFSTSKSGVDQTVCEIEKIFDLLTVALSWVNMSLCLLLEKGESPIRLYSILNDDRDPFSVMDVLNIIDSEIKSWYKNDGEYALVLSSFLGASIYSSLWLIDAEHKRIFQERLAGWYKESLYSGVSGVLKHISTQVKKDSKQMAGSTEDKIFFTSILTQLDEVARKLKDDNSTLSFEQRTPATVTQS